MGLRINTNVPSTTALRNLNLSSNSLTRSMHRLSTGLRINSASDDPSGLVISEQLRAQINSLQQASDNAANASNLLQTGEAALNELNTILISIREAAIYALNTGGASAEQIAAEQASVDQALEAVDRIAATTRFATRSLFNGESGFDIVTRPTEITDLNPISATFDRITGTPSWSAWNCSRKSITEAPPSTRRSRTPVPEADAMASTTSVGRPRRASACLKSAVVGV